MIPLSKGIEWQIASLFCSQNFFHGQQNLLKPTIFIGFTWTRKSLCTFIKEAWSTRCLNTKSLYFHCTARSNSKEFEFPLNSLLLASRPVQNSTWDNTLMQTDAKCFCHLTTVITSCKKESKVQHWSDYKMTWDPKRFGGVRDVRFHGGVDAPFRLWKPDILLFNRFSISLTEWKAFKCFWIFRLYLCFSIYCELRWTRSAESAGDL